MWHLEGAEDRELALKLGASAFLGKPGLLAGYRNLAGEFESLANNLHEKAHSECVVRVNVEG